MDAHTYGCLPPKKDLRDYTIKPTAINESELPDEFSVDKIAKIKNQKAVGSCVAHAASSILEYFDGGRHSLSTNFIYGIHYKLYGSTGPGMYLREACKILKEYGDPLESECSGNTEVTEVYAIAEEAFNNKDLMEAAKQRKIQSYARVTNEDEIKYALYTYGPVLACIKWYSDAKLKNGILVADKTKKYSYHAIVIIGWNKTGFVCQNSWGEKWGDKGYFTLPYDHGISEAYSIIDYKDENTDKIKKKTNNKIFDIIYKLLNFIINLFKGR